MENNRSSSTFVTVDLLCDELLPFVQNFLFRLFFAMLSDIRKKVGTKHMMKSNRSSSNFVTLGSLPSIFRYYGLFKVRFADFSLPFCFAMHSDN